MLLSGARRPPAEPEIRGACPGGSGRKGEVFVEAQARSETLERLQRELEAARAEWLARKAEVMRAKFLLEEIEYQILRIEYQIEKLMGATRLAES